MATTLEPPAGERRQHPGLKRQVGFVGAVALSIGLMSPTGALSLSPAFTAGLAGRAVPLVYLLAAVGVGLVAYSFVHLTRHFNHAGSVYALAGCTLGARAGFFAGWALLGTYVAYAVTSIVSAGLFLGIVFGGGERWIALGLILVVWVVGHLRVSGLTRALLSIEGVLITCVVAIAVVIVVRLLAGTAPDGQGFTLSVFSPAPGVPFSQIALAIVFGFLSFAGFEGAATLGEETTSARRNIPRAFIVTVALAAIFFVALTAVAAMGFGTTAAGVRAFAGSSSVLGDLGRSYIGSGLGDVVNVGVAISAFGGGLAAAVAASRLLFAFGRVGLVPALERGVTRGGNPMVAFNVAMVAVALIYVVMMICGVAVRDIALWLATIGTFPLLFAYAFTTIGAGRYLFGWRHLRPRWEIVVPVLAVAFIGYVLYKNLVPAPASPYDVFPYVAAAWLVLGTVLVVARPRMARSIGADLSQLELADEQGHEEVR